jgi:hypothetical protein
MGVKLGDGDYRTQAAADYAGKMALARLLDELAKKEGAVSVAPPSPDAREPGITRFLADPADLLRSARHLFCQGDARLRPAR